MHDQHLRMLLQIAEARRMHGTSERDGSVHQVWRKGGEQKIRINMGKRPDGSPWLSPWIKTEDHHGSGRKQHKYHKGQNVKLSAAGADFSHAKVTPAGENNAHPEPQHATDYHDTEQFAAKRTRVGPDFEERWMASGGQVQGQDPDKIATVLKRWGAKPDNQNDKGEAWDGPDPNQADPKKRDLNWVGKPGNAPVQNGDHITTQFDKDAKTEHTSGSILKKVQSSDGGQMSTPDTGDGTASRISTDQVQDGNILRKVKDLITGKITSTVHMNGDITHEIQDAQGNLTRITQQLNQMIHQTQSSNGDFSTILHQAGKIFHQVTSGGQTSTLSITGSNIDLNSQSVNVNSNSFSTPTSAPAEPTVSSSGDAPLVVIPTLWSIEAGLKASMNFNPTQWPIGAHLAAIEIMQVVPTYWPIGINMIVTGNLRA
jgi:hypothetical protein